jgi:hypothetical protein
MGGGDGGVIVQDSVKATLTHPLVHGNLPTKWPEIIDPILAKDSSTWTAKEKRDLSAAYSWALQNL